MGWDGWCILSAHSSPHLNICRETPSLGIRNLLEVIESALRKFGFDDPWKEQKTIENKASIGMLKPRLQQLDSIASRREKWTEIVRGVLAGMDREMKGCWWGSRIMPFR